MLLYVDDLIGGADSNVGENKSREHENHNNSA